MQSDLTSVSSVALRSARDKLHRLPWFLVASISFIAVIGMVMMYSAARGNWYLWGERQLVHFCISFLIMITISIVDINIISRYSYHVYALSLILLLLVYIQGHTAMGATRWVGIGPLKLQPSETTKITLILVLSRYFHSLSKDNIPMIRFLIPPIIMTIIPFGFIVKQPDLGTAIILLLIAITVFWVAGIRLWKFILAAVITLSSAPIIWYSGLLHEYQKRRVLTFLNPEHDRLGDGYNIIQSKIAIGSGGLSGQGLMNGTQNQLNFLPEHQTDFIFTMLSEELGFIGGSTIILLYAIMLGYGIYIALRSHSDFGKYLACGVTSLIFIHVFINIAMVTGMIPVVGVPLPLLSYGGSIMLTTMVSFGLLLNVCVHRKTNVVHLFTINKDS